MRWEWLGRMPYANALGCQRELREDVIRGRAPDTLLLLEHPPVITLGKAASPADVRATPEELARRGIEVHHVERGGKVTFHGPGQLVGYPVAHVGGAGVGVARFLTRLGQALVAWLASQGADARFDLRCTGVFAPGGKIASMGIHVSRGVAIHGFALNLATDLEAFQTIVPCGDAAGRITSLARETGRAPTPAAAAPSVAAMVLAALDRCAPS